MRTSSANVRFINPPEMAKPPGYTHVVEVTCGRTVFISGQVAQDANGNVVGVGDFHAQTERVFENLRAALAAVGGTFADVVKMTIFVTNMDHLPVLRAVRDRYVNTAQPPASTAVMVSRLAHPDWMIEIEAVAVLPE